MASCKNLIPKISEWLSQGSLDADTLIDFPWEVSGSGNVLKALYPRFPINVIVSCDDILGIIRLLVRLETETLTLDKDTKLLVYHKFLRRNIAPMVKYALIDDEDVPVLMVDLSIESLGKKEFNDALALLLAGVNDAIKQLGLEEYYKEKMFTNLLSLVKKHIEEGWGSDRVYEYLVKYAGMREKEAREIIKSMLEKKEGEPSVYV